MKAFMDKNFLLQTETAQELFHDAAKNQPILDFHNHLLPQAIYEDKCYHDITEVWLGGDHYKWRAMRANGVSETLITGKSDAYEKFIAWADTVEASIGNPLYHWTHMELQRYFGIDTPLSKKTAKEIWQACNAKLVTKEYSVRNLLRMQHVEVLCTTDDPADTLEWHEKIRADHFDIRVLPAFRPEKAVGIEREGFAEYMQRLSKEADLPIHTVDDVIEALTRRLDFFVAHGCHVSDHTLDNAFYVPTTKDEVNALFQRRMQGEELNETDCGKYHGWLYHMLGKEYAKRGIVMQLHIGAIRNAASRFYKILGPDTGFDSVSDFSYARELAALLDSLDSENALPKTILYYLNSKDANMLAAMIGNYQSNESGIRGKMQLGSAWWFGDHKDGMEYQMKCLADVGLLSVFVGMLTDSRSFLSFPRHEYFRRILCNLVGNWVENGEYPKQMDYLKKMVRGISSENARAYFGF